MQQAIQRNSSDPMQFSYAEILVGNKRIIDFPVSISPSTITLSQYGIIYPSQIQWIKIKKHPDPDVCKHGVQRLTPSILLQWPVVPWQEQRIHPDKSNLKREKALRKKLRWLQNKEGANSEV